MIDKLINMREELRNIYIYLELLGSIYDVDYQVYNFYNTSNTVDCDNQNGIGFQETIV